MTLTILPKLLLAVLVLPLAYPTWAADLEDHGLRPDFHPADCEEWLTDNDEVLRATLLDSFRDFPVLGIGARRVPVIPRKPIDLGAADPRFVWFTAGKKELPSEVKKRIDRLQVEAREFAIAKDPAAKLVDFDVPFGAFEKDALGIEAEPSVGPADLRGQAFASRAGWRIVWRVRDQVVGGLELPMHDARLGYSNAVYEWQWDFIQSQELKGEKRQKAKVEDFLIDNGHAVFTRKSAAGRLFGYELRVYELAEDKWVYQLEVSTARTSRRLAVSTAELVFPETDEEARANREPQTVNLQIIDLGLRLPLDPNPTSE